MKYPLLALSAALVLSGCAGTRVIQTQVASGATSPKAIYIRPFRIAADAYRGSHGTAGAKAIRESQAPAEFAQNLQEELEKLAPTAILSENEAPETGWLVTGELEVVDAGNPALRAVFPHTGVGRSGILVHVRVTEVGGDGEVSDGKANGETAMHKVARRDGAVLYEFDVAGGSRLNGPMGTVTASGLGYSVPFDFRNTAARIAQTLTVDGDRIGHRSASTLR